MKRVEIEAFEDRSRSEGGHAVILLRGIAEAAEVKSFRLRPVETAAEDAAAVPVKDAERGEEVKIYIVLKPGYTPQTVTPQMILDAAARTLAPFKVPRYLEYVAELPRTPSQKIKKDALKALKPDPRVGSFDRVDGTWR